MKKIGPKEILKIKQFEPKMCIFGQNQPLSFTPKAQNLDRPTPHIIIIDLCRENLAQFFACTKKCHQHTFLKTFLPFGWSPNTGFLLKLAAIKWYIFGTPCIIYYDGQKWHNYMTGIKYNLFQISTASLSVNYYGRRKNVPPPPRNQTLDLWYTRPAP